jgi:hypothetical protein
MPRLPGPAPVPGGQTVDVQPYYIRDKQHWAVGQERQRHIQALYTVGEYAMFALMWHLQDFQAGLVDRCQRCYTTDPTSIQARIVAVYNQPTVNKCPDCYGTTFRGGYKALIVRPTIFSDVDQAEQVQARGVTHPATLDVETIADFRVRSGDYVFRGNGDRYVLRVPQRVTVRTGFGEPTMTEQGVGYNQARAQFEDPDASVAYIIGPSKADLAALLPRGEGAHVPQDFSDWEIIHAPLIPEGD